MDLKIIKKEPLTLPQLNKTISGLGKKAERTDIQNKVLDFTKKFGKLSEANSRKLAAELQGLDIPTLTQEHITQIINVLPSDLAELKVVFAGTKTTMTPENFKRIHDVIIKYKK